MKRSPRRELDYEPRGKEEQQKLLSIARHRPLRILSGFADTSKWVAEYRGASWDVVVAFLIVFFVFLLSAFFVVWGCWAMFSKGVQSGFAFLGSVVLLLGVNCILTARKSWRLTEEFFRLVRVEARASSFSVVIKQRGQPDQVLEWRTPPAKVVLEEHKEFKAVHWRVAKLLCHGEEILTLELRWEE